MSRLDVFGSASRGDATPESAFDWPVVSGETQEYFVEELAGMGTFAYGKNVFGCPTITQALIELRQIDEFRLFVQPVALGGGQTLFPTTEARQPLRLTETRAMDGGVAYLHWATA